MHQVFIRCLRTLSAVPKILRYVKQQTNKSKAESVARNKLTHKDYKTH